MTLDPAFRKRAFAHRGLHDVARGLPENSRAAVRAAIAGGYGIEIDCQLSADGAAMVFHDYGLERLAEARGPIRLQKAEDLAKVPLKGGDEGIPTLPEILEIVAGQVPLLVELKDQDGAMGDDLGPLEAAAAAAIADYQGPLALMSFNPNSMARMAELLPGVPRGLVTSAYRPEDWPLPVATCERLREIPDYDRVGASFISHEWDDLGRPRVAELKAQGAMICCWTIRSEAQAREALKVAESITFEGYPAAPDA